MKKLYLCLLLSTVTVLSAPFESYFSCPGTAFNSVVELTLCKEGTERCPAIRIATPNAKPLEPAIYEVVSHVPTEVLFEDPRVVEYQITENSKPKYFFRVGGKRVNIYDSKHALIAKNCLLEPKDSLALFNPSDQELFILSLFYPVRSILEHYLKVGMDWNQVVEILGTGFRYSPLHAFVGRVNPDDEAARTLFANFISRKEVDLNFQGEGQPPLLFRTQGRTQILDLLAPQKHRIQALKSDANGRNYFQALVKEENWQATLKVWEIWPEVLPSAFDGVDQLVLWVGTVIGKRGIKYGEDLEPFYQAFERISSLGDKSKMGGAALQ